MLISLFCHFFNYLLNLFRKKILDKCCQFMKTSDAFYIHSYGASKQPTHSSLETIRVPFGSKVPTDFDAPDVDEELYEDDVRAPDIGRLKFSFLAEN